MLSAMVGELVCETYLQEFQRVTLPAHLRAAHVKQALGSARPPVWRVGSAWLGARLVAAGERLRAVGTVRPQPVG